MASSRQSWGKPGQPKLSPIGIAGHTGTKNHCSSNGTHCRRVRQWTSIDVADFLICLQGEIDVLLGREAAAMVPQCEQNREKQNFKSNSSDDKICLYRFNRLEHNDTMWRQN